MKSLLPVGEYKFSFPAQGGVYTAQWTVDDYYFPVNWPTITNPQDWTNAVAANDNTVNYNSMQTPAAADVGSPIVSLVDRTTGTYTQYNWMSNATTVTIPGGTMTAGHHYDLAIRFVARKYFTEPKGTNTFAEYQRNVHISFVAQ